MCSLHVSWHFLCHYWFQFECVVQTGMTHWCHFCLRRLSYGVTISGSCRARPSLSPAVIVFLQVCLLTGIRLCLTELLQPVRTGLCPAVRLNASIKGHKAKPLLWIRQQNIFCYLLYLKCDFFCCFSVCFKLFRSNFFLLYCWINTTTTSKSYQSYKLFLNDLVSLSKYGFSLREIWLLQNWNHWLFLGGCDLNLRVLIKSAALECRVMRSTELHHCTSCQRLWTSWQTSPSLRGWRSMERLIWRLWRTPRASLCVRLHFRSLQ